MCFNEFWTLCGFSDITLKVFYRSLKTHWKYLILFGEAKSLLEYSTEVTAILESFHIIKSRIENVKSI